MKPYGTETRHIDQTVAGRLRTYGYPPLGRLLDGHTVL